MDMSEEQTNNNRVAPQRLLGTYPQRQEGKLMQRIPLLGGRIEPSQWQAIADIARQFTLGTPLHLTTRQDIELHNIAEADIGAVYEQLRLAGFDTFGACGDCVRNITLCPGCEFHDGAAEVVPAAELVRKVLFSSPVLSSLPRKFKISFSACAKACARPFINDLGFVANADGSFRAIGAGSLGSRPQLGIELYWSLTVEEVVWLATAALEMFAELGDRQNRRKARLRHVRQRLGDEEFKSQLKERFDKKRQTSVAEKLNSAVTKEPMPYQVTLQLITGRIPLEDVESLAVFCEHNRVVTRINLTHGIELFGDKPIGLPAELSKYENLPCIVACPGNDTCSNGLTDCRKLATRLTDSLGGGKWKNKVIAISGCSNHCAQSAVADVGLCGCVKTIDNQRQEAYQVWAGGGCGKNDKLAEMREIISAEQIPQKIETLWKNNTGKE
jgi:sulfite reductase beta subunit-like hemoprotein